MMSGNDIKPSGRFLLRIDPELHAALRREAAEAGTSLNEYCARKLAGGAAPRSDPRPVDAAVRRAAWLLGRDLVGVVLFGSRARGQAREHSDVDVLIVADRAVRLIRDLYSRWDEDPVVDDGHRVEPLFVHLPPAGETVVGLWAEVAVDGIVLFARDLELPSRLAAIRRDIADGRIVRKTSHGQPYWVKVA